MPEFVNERLAARFTLPDKPTLYQILAYDSKRLELDGKPDFLILFEMAKILIQEWECPDLPDFRADLTTLEMEPEQAGRAARAVEWAGSQVSRWRLSLDKVPKNS